MRRGRASQPASHRSLDGGEIAVKMDGLFFSYRDSVAFLPYETCTPSAHLLSDALSPPLGSQAKPQRTPWPLSLSSSDRLGRTVARSHTRKTRVGSPGSWGVSCVWSYHYLSGVTCSSIKRTRHAGERTPGRSLQVACQPQRPPVQLGFSTYWHLVER